MTSSRPSRFGLSALLLASVLAISQGNLLAAALALIQEQYRDVSNSTLLVRIMLFAPGLAMLLAGPFVGRLVDRFEKSVILAVALVVFCVLGLHAYVTTDLYVLIGSRLALGVVLAIIIAANTSLIAEYFPGAQRATWLGWQTAAVGIAGTVFPFIGGVAAAVNWRYSFLIYPLVLPLALAAWRLPRTSSSAAQSSVPFRPMKVWDVYATAFAGSLILNLITTQLAFHLKTLGWPSTVTVGAMMSISAFTCALVSLIYGQIKARLSYQQITIAAFLFMGLGNALIAFGATSLPIIAGLALAGIGFGLNIPNNGMWLLGRVEPEVRGRAVAMLTSVIYGSQFLCLFIYEALTNRLGSRATFTFAALASVPVLIWSMSSLRAAKGSRAAV